MTRSMQTLGLCIVGLLIPGCYDHRTIEESTLSPISVDDDKGDGADDAGSEPVETPDEDAGSNDPGDEPGDGEADAGGGGDNMGPGGIDCDNPQNQIEEFFCNGQNGGDNGGGMNGFPNGSDNGDGMNGFIGGDGNGDTGGFPGGTGGQPGDIQDIIDGLLEGVDCEAEDLDFLSQILCQLQGAGMGGGGFPGGGGGGFPGGGTGGFPGGGGSR